MQKNLEESKTNSSIKSQYKKEQTINLPKSMDIQQETQGPNLKQQKLLFKISKDKKMADVIESVAGAITQIAGLTTAHKFLKNIGVLKYD